MKKLFFYKRYTISVSSRGEKTSGGGNAKSRTGKWQEERKRQQIQTKLQVLLFRHKELLKKDILKKRALLEKDLQIVIQVSKHSLLIMTLYTKYE